MVSSLHTYTEQFYEVFPYYLSIGMSADDFWNGDPTLAKYYRRADEIRKERENERLWLQGMYVYEAISDLAPILHAFAKRGTHAKPYPSEPYSLTRKERKEADERKAKQVYDKGMRMMEYWMNKAKSS